MYLAFLIILLLGFIALFISLNRKVGKLSQSITDAINEFDEKCNVKRYFSEAEKVEYKIKYQELYETSRKSYNALLTPRNKELLRNFVCFYDCLDDKILKNNECYNDIVLINKRLNEAYKQYDYLMNKNDYFTWSEKEEFVKENVNFVACLEKVFNEKLNTFLDNEDYAKVLLDGFHNINRNREYHNRCFIDKELADNKVFFDSAAVGALSAQQRDSVVRLEDNCLVISSAGSGKTKTMVGKLHYLVKKRKIDPDRILVLTYTKAAANELSERLTSTLLQGRTFHSIAMEVVSQVTGNKPSIAPNDLFLNVFNYELKNIDFLKSVVCYLEKYQSGVKPQEKYDSASDYYSDRKKYGIQALYSDMDDNIIFTKSEEEKRICNYLTHMGLNFRYEESYEYTTSTPTFAQYKPDFSIHYVDDKGNKKRIYLENFAIGVDGNVPKWFGDGYKGGWAKANSDYKKGIEWKKQLHAEKGTTLISITSADFANDNAENKLKELLKSNGVPINKVSEDVLYEKIAKRSKNIEKSVLEMCQGFISLLKANRKTIKDVAYRAKINDSERDSFIINKIMKPLYEKYETALVQRNEIDFTDAILQATDYCNKGFWKEYDYILVDEFQDISLDRYQFLQALRRKSPLTKLYCVGDDWQSIYRFSGSDVNLFTKFSDYFGFTEECRLETTYRFNNPLVDVSSEFIQKNPEQKKKTVRPLFEGNRHTNIDTISYTKNQDIYSVIEQYINRIPEDKSIYILGRYSYDVNSLNNFGAVETASNGSVIVRFNKRKIPFLTIHSSKGLEADYVFLLNCNSGIYGFPSMISDDPVLDYVLSESDHYPYGEERRVFYVAITRAKEQTYILYDIEKPSIFVTEMFNKVSRIPENKRCPICKSGKKVVLKRGVAKNGCSYINWGCDNYSAGCSYFEREFVKIEDNKDTINILGL